MLTVSKATAVPTMTISNKPKTNNLIAATDASGVTIGKASIAAAPFKRNRSTDYSGPLFGTSGENSVMLNNEWSEPFVGEW